MYFHDAECFQVEIFHKNEYRASDHKELEATTEDTETEQEWTINEENIMHTDVTTRNA
jgi:hypothetical protein